MRTLTIRRKLDVGEEGGLGREARKSRLFVQPSMRREIKRWFRQIEMEVRTLGLDLGSGSPRLTSPTEVECLELSLAG